MDAPIVEVAHRCRSAWLGMVPAAFDGSIVLVHEATCDGGIALGVMNPSGTGLRRSRRMDEDQPSSSAGPDATMRRASSMLKPRTEPFFRSPERCLISSAHAAWIAASLSSS